MHLSELMKESASQSNALKTFSNVLGHGDPDVVGIASNSREVKPGYIFAALPGNKVDGVNFVDDAVSRGAVAIILKIHQDAGIWLQLCHSSKHVTRD